MRTHKPSSKTSRLHKDIVNLEANSINSQRDMIEDLPVNVVQEVDYCLDDLEKKENRTHRILNKKLETANSKKRQKELARA